MLVFAKANLVYLAVPKTGSSAVEKSLRGEADIVFAKGRKHITARRYRADVAPFLKTHLNLRAETCAVMRDPLDQMRSWYRYRARLSEKDHPKSTRHLSFDTFVRDALSNRPAPHAKIGSQFRFLTNTKGAIIVHHLFAYEHLELFQDFLANRLELPVVFSRVNTSERRDTHLAPETLTALQKARAADFTLHDKLLQAGGYLGVAIART